MVILQIEHKVPDFDGWKKAFDSDPINRRKSDVKRYRVCRLTGDPNYVVVDLEFDDLEAAQKVQAALKNLWNKIEGTIMVNPQTRILEVTEFKEY